MKAKPALFIDRDGTLITNRAYSNDPDGICWYPGVFNGLRILQRMGYHLVVVSNQSAVARGYCSLEDVERFNAVLAARLETEGIINCRFYFSPYHPEGVVEPFNCDHPSRKPSPGMLLEAARELKLDLGRCLMVGDSRVDLEAGRHAGCRTVLVLSGHGRKNLEEMIRGEMMAPDAVIPFLGALPEVLKRVTRDW